MPEPIYKTATNKRTGQVARFVSEDGGQSWAMVEAPGMPAEADIAPTIEAPAEPTVDAQPSEPPPPALPAGENMESEGFDLPAFGRGAGQAASFGFGDEAAGFGAKLASLVHGEPRRLTRGVGGVPTGETSYEAERDAEREANAEAASRAEGEYALGELAGTFGTAALPGGAAVKGVQGAGRLARAARLARNVGRSAAATATAAGIEGVGRSEAETAEGVLSDAAGSAERAAVTGVALPAVGAGIRATGRGIARGLRGVAEKASKAAPRERLAQAGLSNKEISDIANSRGGAERYTERAKDLEIGTEGTLPALPRKIADDAERVLEESEQKKDFLAKALESEQVTIQPGKIARSIRALKSKHGKGPEGEKIRNKLEKKARAFDGMDDSSWTEINRERMDTGAASKFRGGTARDQANASINARVYSVISNEMKRSAGKAGGKAREYGRLWKQAQEDEHVAITLRDAAEKAAEKSSGRPGLMDIAFVASGGGIGALKSDDAGGGGVAGALGGLALSRTLRGRGPGALAATYEKTARGTGALARAIERGGSAISRGLRDGGRRYGVESSVGQIGVNAAARRVAQALEENGVEAAANEHYGAAHQDPKYRAVMLRSINK